MNTEETAVLYTLEEILNASGYQIALNLIPFERAEHLQQIGLCRIEIHNVLTPNEADQVTENTMGQLRCGEVTCSGFFSVSQY